MRKFAALLTLPLALASMARGEGPSLSETMAFLQRSLLDDGRELYESANRILSVHADACRIGWTHSEIGNRFSGSVIRTKELNLADLDASQIKGWNSIGVLRLVTYNSEPRIVVHSTRYFNNKMDQRDAHVSQLELEFQDATITERVAKAFQHAAKLCGAKATKDPF